VQPLRDAQSKAVTQVVLHVEMPGMRRRHCRFYQAVQQEAGGSQDDLSHEEDDDKDNDGDNDDDLDDKVGNVAPVAVAAEELT
jgi:hypothetical protein